MTLAAALRENILSGRNAGASATDTAHYFELYSSIVSGNFDATLADMGSGQANRPLLDILNDVYALANEEFDGETAENRDQQQERETNRDKKKASADKRRQ